MSDLISIRSNILDKKILICTIESWNSKVGANTFSTLFKDYPSENLANVYIREELPDSKCCKRYFQISEIKAFKSILNRRIKTGREVKSTKYVNADDEDTINKSKNLYNINRKKRSYFKLFIRELLWFLSKWKTKELDDFINEFNPDIVLFGMEGYIHFNRICRYIVKKTKAKAVGYFWDDNFTYKQMPNNVGRNFLRFFQRKSLKKLVGVTDSFWAITEKTKEESDEFFGIDCKVLTKPIDFEENEKWTRNIIHQPIRMLYTGNLLIGRFNVIKTISNALDKINVNEPKIILDIYTASYLTKEQLNSLGNYVNVNEAVTQEEVINLQKKADVLLFVEAYNDENSKIARLSFSTKLTDYFHSGKCIFAIGDKDIAPIEYLIENDAALCASSDAEILNCLNKIICDDDLMNYYGERSYNLGLNNHSRSKINKVINETFEEFEN